MIIKKELKKRFDSIFGSYICNNNLNFSLYLFIYLVDMVVPIFSLKKLNVILLW